ncbi:MAG: imidazolonepropionase [Caulobacter sp.]|nr:imidazolonepropionase [Caulobacter sp.]
MQRIDLIITDCRAATMVAGATPYGVIEDALIAVHEGRIAWIGPRAEAPDYNPFAVTRLDGRWVTPGLIDCHTHLVFGGDRIGEFEARLGGATYEAIALAGGGVRSSVAATREANEADLIKSARRRLGNFVAEGVTTIEIKSGYGLDQETELKMLRVARYLDGDARVVTSFLGLHAAPKDQPREAWIDMIIDETLPAASAQGLVDIVDAYLETIAFTPAEVSRLFDKARALGLPVRLHADQLSDGGGAALAASHGALSADHLEFTSQAGVEAMARAGTVAVLLPGAFIALAETQKPPVAALRAAGVPIAVASDCNPGTSPLLSLRAAMMLACAQFRLTPEEALAGVTRNAAQALGLGAETGTLEAGKLADMACWDIERPAELSYWLGGRLLSRSWRAGRPVVA